MSTILGESPARRALGVLAFVAVLPLSAGCASRAVPFDKLDDAQVTILKLQQPQAAAAPTPAPGGLPFSIPGLTPEQQQQINQFGEAAVQQLQQLGVLPPGFQLPGQPGAAPTAPPKPMFRNQYEIADQRPVVDESLKEQLLDLFGGEDNFNAQRGNCFYPGMAVSFISPEQPEPVDVVVSLSCNQVVGYGFQWPHPNSGLTTETHATLTQVYQNHFGPVPPGA